MPRRFSITTIILLLLLTGVGIAQELPDAPGVQVGTFPSPKSLTKFSKNGAPVAAQRPLVDPTIADSAYWTSTGALFATTFVNVEMTARCVEQHTCLSSIAPNASRGRLYAYTLPTDGLLSFLSYKLKSKRRWWALPELTFTTGNLFSAGRSYGRLR